MDQRSTGPLLTKANAEKTATQTVNRLKVGDQKLFFNLQINASNKLVSMRMS